MNPNHIETLKAMSESELISFIADMAIKARKALKKANKSSDAEIDAGLTSRSTQTTLTARAWNDREDFNRDVDALKTAVRFI